MASSAAAAVLCAWPAAASGEVDPFSLSPEQLFNATVTSVSKTAEKLGTAPAAVFVLTSEDIARSGATSIAEALRLVPGVEVIRASTSSWGISIRGFNSGLANKLLVLIDGREVYDPLFSGVYWDVQDTALEDIERIEVVRGPGGTLWGANAVNGVINIITKSAAQTQGAMVSVVAGDRDRAIVTGRYGAKIDDANVRLYAKYLDRAPNDLPTGGDAADAWQEWRTGFRADWDTTAQGDSFTLQGDAYRSTSSGLHAAPQLTPPYAFVLQDEVVAEGGNLLGRWNRELGDNSRLTVQAYVDTSRRKQFTLEDRRTSFDFDAQYQFPAMDGHELIAGMRYRYTDSKLTATPFTTFENDRRRDQLISGFIQDKIALDDSWFLTVGSKFEHNDYTGFEAQPSLRLQGLVDEQQTVWASVGRAVRVPSWLEHDLTVWTSTLPPGGVPTKVQLAPTPSFESEELVAYELGYRVQCTPEIQVDVAAFFNDYDKLATLIFQTPFFDSGPPVHRVLPIAITNATSGETYGFEIAGGWRASETLNFSAAYSFIEIALHGPPPSVAFNAEIGERQAPQQQFNVRAQWDVADNVALDSTLYFVDDAPAFDIDAYLRWDLRVGWRVDEALQVELIGQDLGDSTGSDASPVEIGRAVLGRLTWRN